MKGLQSMSRNELLPWSSLLAKWSGWMVVELWSKRVLCKVELSSQGELVKLTMTLLGCYIIGDIFGVISVILTDCCSDVSILHRLACRSDGDRDGGLKTGGSGPRTPGWCGSEMLRLKVNFKCSLALILVALLPTELALLLLLLLLLWWLFSLINIVEEFKRRFLLKQTVWWLASKIARSDE